MKTTRVIDFFGDLTDHRSSNGNKQHELLDIIAITICAVVCGAESWEEISEYGRIKKEWLSSFLSLPNGIPSHDTFNRVMSSLDPQSFESCFSNWVSSLIVATNEVISIDGKTICGAKVNGKSPIHMVSAWASKNNIALGQVKVNEKSNEITAIPVLIESLAIEGAIITIDAMGCQKEIAKKIISRNADYVLALKENQPELLEEVEDEFRFSPTNDSSIDVKDKVETAVRYYISSLDKSAEEFQTIIRSHWAIENKLHWSLDVAFNEDLNRKRALYASQNFSLINKIALNLAKNEKTCKLGIKSKRKIAGWDENYLLKVLGF